MFFRIMEPVYFAPRIGAWLFKCPKCDTRSEKEYKTKGFANYGLVTHLNREHKNGRTHHTSKRKET